MADVDPRSLANWIDYRSTRPTTLTMMPVTTLTRPTTTTNVACPSRTNAPLPFRAYEPCVRHLGLHVPNIPFVSFISLLFLSHSSVLYSGFRLYRATPSLLVTQVPTPTFSTLFSTNTPLSPLPPRPNPKPAPPPLPPLQRPRPDPEQRRRSRRDVKN